MAVKAKALNTNPAAGHRAQVQRRTMQEGDVLDMAQVLQLVAHVRDAYKPALWLLALAGLRPSELCGLRVTDVDYVRHTVTVRSTLTPVHPFAGERSRLCEGPPKTSAGRRTIPVPAN